MKRKRGRRISAKTLCQHFDMPIAEAAERLNLSVNGLKKICRRNNISRWPHKEILATEKLRAKVEGCISKGQISQSESKSLEALRDSLKEQEDLWRRGIDLRTHHDPTKPLKAKAKRTKFQHDKHVSKAADVTTVNPSDTRPLSTDLHLAQLPRGPAVALPIEQLEVQPARIAPVATTPVETFQPVIHESFELHYNQSSFMFPAAMPPVPPDFGIMYADSTSFMANDSQYMLPYFVPTPYYFEPPYWL